MDDGLRELSLSSCCPIMMSVLGSSKASIYLSVSVNPLIHSDVLYWFICCAILYEQIKFTSVGMRHLHSGPDLQYCDDGCQRIGSLSSQRTLAAPNLLRLVWENVGEWQLSPQQVYLSPIKILPLIKANLINAFSTCSITAPLQCSHTRALKEPPTREPKPPREQLNKVHLLACLLLSPALTHCHFAPLNVQSWPPHAVLSKLLKWEKIDGNFGKNFGHRITMAYFLVQLKVKMLISSNNCFYSVKDLASFIFFVDERFFNWLINLLE